MKGYRSTKNWSVERLDQWQWRADAIDSDGDSWQSLHATYASAVRWATEKSGGKIAAGDTPARAS